jgi:glyoxylase-like metal-dependent hydrolase (beta-lactamase superfamily II)
MEIVELRPGLHLIKPVFGQAYLWRDGSQLTMGDTGIPGSENELLAAFTELGYRRADLRRVIVTHGHEDHAGSAAAVRSWGDVEVLAAYSHSAQAADLGLCHTVALTNPMCVPKTDESVHEPARPSP